MNQADDIDALQIGPDPDKLFVYHRRQLSAMLDGELSPDEAKFMLRRLQHDTELATCWERWQVCGDVLRGQRNALLPADFAQRVARAVGGRDAVAEGGRAQPARAAGKPRLMRWGGGAAMAASVALLAVFAGRQLPDPGVEGALPAPIVAAGTSAGAAVNPAASPLAAADAVADAGDRQPAPASPLRDATVALTAAVAVADVPRRAAERRSRAQAQRAASRLQAARQAEAPIAVAAAHVPVIRLPDAEVAGAVVDTHFAMPPAATVSARPWPRALLPAAGNAYAVGFGQASREPGFEPFRPREIAGLATPPAADAGPHAEPVPAAPDWP